MQCGAENVWLSNLLANTKVRDLPSIRDQIVLEFGKEDLIRDVYDALIGRGVLSAPVFCLEEEKYIGFVDLRDLVGKERY